jgi:hypothetical protein
LQRGKAGTPQIRLVLKGDLFQREKIKLIMGFVYPIQLVCNIEIEIKKLDN